MELLSSLGLFWPVGVGLIKDELYSALRLPEPAEGEQTPALYCHFPRDRDEDWFQQLTSERKVVKPNAKGIASGSWKLPEGTRNEGLDCRVYARAAAFVHELDTWTPEKWERARLATLPEGERPSEPATRVEGADAERLEALIRYVARPPLAQGRLEIRGDGKVKWTLRKPWRDGTRAFVFEPLTFLERLAALVPHPREHGWTYHGSLAPASTLRDRIVPRPIAPPRADSPTSCDASPHRRSWAELLERAFAEDVLRCPRCGGRRHRIATITDPLVARRILRHIGARYEPLPLAPARPPPQGVLSFA